MAQRLQVFQDPSIVQNVPTTPLEQLQLALDAKAAKMAASQGTSPLAQAVVSAAAQSPSGLNANDIVVNKPAKSKTSSAGTVNAATPLDNNYLGLTPSPKQKSSPGLNAIDSAAPPLANGGAFNGGWGSNGVLTYQPSNPGPAPVGDPWGPVRVGAVQPARPGMVTANAQRTIAARPLVRQPVQTAIQSNSPAPTVANAIARYLQDSGAPQTGNEANDYRNATMNSGSRNADGSRGFM